MKRVIVVKLYENAYTYENSILKPLTVCHEYRPRKECFRTVEIAQQLTSNCCFSRVSDVGSQPPMPGNSHLPVTPVT